MKILRVAVIPGDGIGPEVVAQGKRVLAEVARLSGEVRFECTDFPWGCDYYLAHGRTMPENGLEILRSFDVIYLGAIGSPGVPDHVSLRELLLAVRVGFDQYVNLRPIRLLSGVPSPLVGKGPEHVQMTFIRENVEGEYAGLGGRHGHGADELAVQTGVFTRRRLERLFRYAFSLARREGRSVTSVTKSNALNHSMVFWDEVFQSVARDFPDVPTRSLLADAAALQMIRAPETFEVVVASNLFGDILTDLGAALQGGVGLAASGNLNPERRFPSMFEPVHGSAPDIAGQGKANPIAAIWTVKLLLDFVGLECWGARVIAAIEATLQDGSVLTPDLGGRATTDEVGEAVLRHLRRIAAVS